MKTTKKIILSSLALGGVVSAFTFAANTTTGTNLIDGFKKGGFSGMMQNMSEMGRGHGDLLGRFIDYTSLTEEQKTAIETLKTENKSAMDKLMESMKTATTTESKTEIETQMQNLRKTYLESLKQYVSEDKLTEYQTFIDNTGKQLQAGTGDLQMFPMGGDMGGMRGGRGHGGDELGRFIDYSKLTDDQKTSLTAAKKTYLESLKQYVSEDKLTEYQTFIDNTGKQPQSSTGDLQMPSMGDEGDDKGGMRGGRGHGDLLGRFIDYTSLTEEQKTAIETLKTENKAAMDKLMESMKTATTTESKTEIKTQIQVLRKTYLESMKQYVSADKLTDYETFLNQIAK